MSHPKPTSYPQLERGQLIPAFTLPGTDGMPHGPWDYKQRDHLLLLFAPSTTSTETRTLLHTFVQQYTTIREEHCAILVITADTVIANLQVQEQLRLPFPLLADPAGNVIPLYTHWEPATRALTPAIILADRYNALYRQWMASNEAHLPSINELLECLQYLNNLCTP